MNIISCKKVNERFIFQNIPRNTHTLAHTHLRIVAHCEMWDRNCVTATAHCAAIKKISQSVVRVREIPRPSKSHVLSYAMLCLRFDLCVCVCMYSTQAWTRVSSANMPRRSVRDFRKRIFLCKTKSFKCHAMETRNCARQPPPLAASLTARAQGELLRYAHMHKLALRNAAKRAVWAQNYKQCVCFSKYLVVSYDCRPYYSRSHRAVSCVLAIRQTLARSFDTELSAHVCGREAGVCMCECVC